MMNQSVSVVVPAYNCSQTIAEVIKALLNQTIKPQQIIIVDDGSSDDTASIIKSFDKITYIYQDNGGPATARNNGAKHATSDYIFFTDSDCVARKDWLEKAIIHFNRDDIAVVCGSYDIVNSESILARCIHKEILFRHNTLMPDYPKAFGSYNFGIQKGVFDQLGGFNEQYRFASGEDNDLSYKVLKAGYKIYFAKDSLVAHVHTHVLAKYLKEQFRHGFWRVKMYLTHPEMMRGDDYTFWKDIVEVGLCELVLFLGFLVIFFPHLVFYSASGLVLLVLLELWFGLKTAGNYKDGIYFAYVLFLRSFARFFGFLTGTICLFPVFFFVFVRNRNLSRKAS